MIANIILYTLFCFLILIPCGSLVLRFLNLRFNASIYLNVGIIVFTFIFYFTSLLKLNILFLPLVLIPAIYEFKFVKRVKRLKVDWLLTITLVVTVILQSLITTTSGFSNSGDLKLINVHNYDSLWMLSLTNAVGQNVPPVNLGFDAKIQNYHYFLNTFIAGVQNVTKIPSVDLYFKIVSPFLIFLFSATSYIFIKQLTNSRFAGLGGTILLSLSSNYYYLASLIYPNSLTTPSVFWINEYETKIVNYQLLLSYIVILTLLYLINKQRPGKFSLKQLIFYSLLLGSLILIKSFASVIIIPALFFVGIINLKRKDYFYILLGLLTTFFSFVFYLTSNPTFQNSFIIEPFYLIRTMFETSDHLNYSEWILKVQTYTQDNNIKRIIQLYLQGTLLFIIGNLGLRLIGLFSILQKEKMSENKSIVILVTSIGTFGLLASLVLVAKGTAWNSVQFSYYSVFAFSILTIYVLNKFSTKLKLVSILIFFITWLTLVPGVFHITQNYLSKTEESNVNQELYDASLFLSKQQKGKVLVNPKYNQTSFVSAISNQNVFLENTSMLDIQMIDYQSGKVELEEFFKNKRLNIDFIQNNNIRYILTDRNDSNLYDPDIFSTIYSSDNFIIYTKN